MNPAPRAFSRQYRCNQLRIFPLNRKRGFRLRSAAFSAHPRNLRETQQRLRASHTVLGRVISTELNHGGQQFQQSSSPLLARLEQLSLLEYCRESMQVPHTHRPLEQGGQL